MTPFQVEASAKAPWTSTTVGLDGCGCFGAAMVFVAVRASAVTAIAPRAMRRRIEGLVFMSVSVSGGVQVDSTVARGRARRTRAPPGGPTGRGARAADQGEPGCDRARRAGW